MTYESKRAFKTPEFKIAFIMGMIIVLSHIVFSKIPEAISMSSYMNENFEMKYPESCYVAWIGIDNRFYMYLYLLILPVIAAMPYSTSLFTDLKGSIAANVITRVGKLKYLRNKFIAVFISGGIVSCIPLIVDMLLCFMLFPAVNVEPASKAVLMPKGSFSLLYYEHPLVYFIICLVMIYIYSGVMSVFCLTSTFYVKHKYSVMINGFIIR